MAAGEIVNKADVVEALPDGDMPRWLNLAYAEVGTREEADGGSNPVVEAYAQEAAHVRIDARDVPWCAYFVGSMLTRAGFPSTGSGMARSYLNYGQKVAHTDSSNWKAGDIAVFWRGKNDDHVMGHVGFLVSWTRSTITLLSGNVQDKVCIADFSRAKLIGVCRPRSVTSSRTVHGVSAAGGAEATRQVVEAAVSDLPVKRLPNPDQVQNTIDQIRSPLEVLAQFKPWILGFLSFITVAGILYAAWARLDDHRSGRNS